LSISAAQSASISTPSDPDSTGQVMEFRVRAGPVADPTTPPQYLQLPAITSLGSATNTQHVNLNEEAYGAVEEEPPVAALLGTFYPGENRWYESQRYGAGGLHLS
jgi:hypothetical protein